MARTQKPLDGDAPALRFAARLRQTRQRAGLTLRQLSTITGYSPSTLSIAESGRRLPSWDVASAFVQGCRETDVARWKGWWEAAAEREEAAAGREEAAAGREEAADRDEASAADAGMVGTGTVRTGTAPVLVDGAAIAGPATVTVVRTRWWPVVLATVLSSALTAAIFLIHPFTGTPAAGAGRPTPPSYPAGSDPMPVSNCGGGPPGYGCHKKDPNATHCVDDATLASLSVMSYQGKPVIRLENWYSKKCGTNWAQLRLPSGWQGRVEIATQTARDCFPTDCQELFQGQPPYWTNMLFGMNQPTAATGYVQMPTGEVRKMEAATGG